jgi:hypothetical protein
MLTSGCSKYHRHSIRLAGYDYSQPGVYFITICTHGRCLLLGEAVECQIRLNEWGRVARDIGWKSPLIFRTLHWMNL